MTNYSILAIDKYGNESYINVCAWDREHALRKFAVIAEQTEVMPLACYLEEGMR